MKITLESTDRIVQLKSSTHGGTVPGRVWQGKTESGIQLFVVITSLAVERTQDQSEFQAAFQEHTAPEAGAIQAFPLRFII